MVKYPDYSLRQALMVSACNKHTHSSLYKDTVNGSISIFVTDMTSVMITVISIHSIIVSTRVIITISPLPSHMASVVMSNV